MAIIKLYIFLQPLIDILIDILGTICLILLAAAGTLYAFLWIMNKIWKYLLAAGAITLLVTVMGLVLGVV